MDKGLSALFARAVFIAAKRDIEEGDPNEIRARRLDLSL